MKITKWIYFGVPLMIGVGMLLASQPKDKQLPPTRRIDFDYDSTWNGVPLTSAESTTVASAINNIATPPPDSISYTNAAGSTITVSCSTLAANLKAQLDSGDIERETQNGADGGEYGGEINVAGRHLARAGTSAAGMTFLEELLIHEETHKGAHQDGQTSDENEVESYGAELAYKDSIGLDSASNSDYRDALSRLKTHQENYDLAELLKRLRELIDALGKTTFIDHGEGLDPDFFKSHALTGGDYVYDLSPFLKASDMMIHENYFMLPPEHCLALICGGDPIVGHARLLGLDIFDGMVQPPEPYFLQDYEFPMFDNMFFYSMAYSEDMDRYYFVDTLNHQVVTMGDYDGDLIPDMGDLTTFASAFTPGFEQLFGMRSVEPTMHRYHGYGLIVNYEDARYTDAIAPYDERFFLQDINGDNVADMCIPAMRFEFVTCKPHIVDPPWDGEISVRLLASWDHPIEVWSTDSLGQDFYELLGMIHMEMPHMDCWIDRPLMAGEFILGIDMENGRKLNLATKVIDPTPQDFVIHMDPDGAINGVWEKVKGADYYNIYESDDPFLFPPMPSYTTTETFIPLPIPPDEKRFYRVTAAKEDGPMR